MTLECLIGDLGGCGLFQVVVVSLVYLSRIAAAMSMILMAFGNYNPGWQCVDGNNTSYNNTLMVTLRNDSNDKDECDDLFPSCAHVQFTPGVSTVISEWHLICDREWISSLIISIQMVGVLIGSFATGYLGDRFGRKLTLYGVTVYHMVVNVITIFSNSWYMFAAMRFLIGLALPVMTFIPVVLSIEYVQYKWRPAAMSFPTFSVGCTISALFALATQDWKWMHGINAIASFIAVLPFYWVPDSLRWLVVKDRMQAANAIVNTMARMNGIDNYDKKDVEEIATRYRSQPKQRSYSYLHLLRKGVRYPTFAIGFTTATMSLIFYAISFGVKSMPGNFYTNLIIIGCCDIPISIISAILPNYIGRKKSSVIFLTLSTVSILTIVGLDLLADGGGRTIGILVGAMLTRMNIEAAWDTIQTYTGEFYPTVIRSTSIAYTSWSARIGGILAPYLIADNTKTFTNYLIMGILAMICSVLVIFLLESPQQTMKDVWTAAETGANKDKEKEDEIDQAGYKVEKLNSRDIL